MVFINTILSFIFQRYCLCETFFYRVGYLLEGEMSSSHFENQTTNLKNVYTDISCMGKKGMLLGRFNEQYTVKRENNKIGDKNSANINEKCGNKCNLMESDEKVNKKKSVFYKHVIFDRKKKFWFTKLDDLTFLQAYEIKNKEEEFKILGTIDNINDQESSKYLKKLYETAFERCLFLINILIKTYCRSRYLDFEKFEIEYHELKELKNEIKEKEFNAEEKFSTLLKKLKENDCNLPKCPEQGASIEDKEKYNNNIIKFISSIQQVFSREYLKSLVGDKKEEDEKKGETELMGHTQKYHDLMNEIGKFLKEYAFTNYSLMEEQIEITLKKKKIFGYYFNFEEENSKGSGISQEKEPNQDEWIYVNIEENTEELKGTNVGVETKKNENSLKEDIKYSDLEFTNKTSKVVKIEYKYVEIYKNSEKKQFMVLIDMKELKREKISRIKFKGKFKSIHEGEIKFKEYDFNIEKAYDISYRKRENK